MKKQTIRKIVFIGIILLFILFKLFILFNYYHFPSWDESVYIGMAKAMISSGKTGLWEEIRPPLLPLLFKPLLMITLVLKLPSNPLFLLDLLMLFFAIGVLILVHSITKYFIKQQQQFEEEQQLQKSQQSLQSFQLILPAIAALSLAFSPLFFIESSKYMTEIPSSFFILLTFYLTLKQKHPFLIGLSAALAFLMKFPNFLLIAAITIYYLFIYFESKNKMRVIKDILFTYAGFLLLFIPFLILNFILYKHYTESIFAAIFYPLLQGSLHQSNLLHKISPSLLNVLYYPYILLKENLLLIFSIFTIFLIKKLNEIKLLLIMLVIYLMYFTAIVNKQPRFSLLFLPIVVILAGIVINEIIQFMQEKRIAKNIFIIFLVIVLIFTIYFSIQKTILEIKQYYPKTQPEIVTNYYHFFDNYSEDTRIITTDPIFAAYSNLKLIPAYNNVTDLSIIFNQNKATAAIMIYDSEFYPYTNNDQECEEQKQVFLDMLIKNYQLLYTRKDGNSEKYIFQLNK